MKDSLTVTRMLFLVVTVFLVVEIPIMIINILYALSSEDSRLIDHELAKRVVIIINSLTCLSSPLNLAIYCGSSKQFRDTFRDVFVLKTERVLPVPV